MEKATSTVSDVLPVVVTVNGRIYHRNVEPRLLLIDFLRDELHLTGTHIGCEEGICGACTVDLDGRTTKSCLVFTVQVDGAMVTTIEGVAADSNQFDPIQTAFMECYALQCGYCTPGMVMSTRALLSNNSHPSEEDIRAGLVGNLCRCTGYQNIVRAVERAAQLISNTTQNDEESSDTRLQSVSLTHE